MAKAPNTRFLPLNRPEYVVNPELFQVALAWECINLASRPSESSTVTDAYAYSREGSDPKSLEIKRTAPIGSHVGLDSERRFYEGIAEELGISFDEGRIVGQAVANSLGGIKPPRAKAQSALPITLETSMLQDLRGISGKMNPSNLGRNIDMMYWLGGGGKYPSASAAWWSVVEDAETHFATGWIARVAREFFLPKEVEFLLASARVNVVNDSSSHVATPVWLASSQTGTPFSWFAASWDTLCDKSWHGALPVRRWSDWASCVLRTVIGLGFLWEMHFYSRLVNGLLDRDLDAHAVVEACLSTSTGLLFWDEGLGLTSRDIASYLKRLVQQGTSAMNAVQVFIEDNGERLSPAEFSGEDNGLAKWVEKAREALDEDQRKKLSVSLRDVRSSGWRNTEETIRYALLCRDPYGRNADYYGLLRKRGSRYTIVAPSSEWLVVVASLAAGKPGGEIHLEQLIRSLHSLGLKPDYQTLIGEVERAGLGRGSHDADEAISVIAGF
jgi:hypothetical protein